MSFLCQEVYSSTQVHFQIYAKQINGIDTQTK